MNDELAEVYESWRTSVRLDASLAGRLGPPLLVSPPDSYRTAGKRVILYRPELLGWAWRNRSARARLPYPKPWQLKDVTSFGDFKRSPYAVRAMMLNYDLFASDRLDYPEHGDPLRPVVFALRAARASGALWTTLVRMEFRTPDAEPRSIRKADNRFRAALLERQRGLVQREIAILNPTACLFVSDPYWDAFIEGTFGRCRFETLAGFPERLLVRLRHETLPYASFRTLEPARLDWRQRDRLEATIAALMR